MKRSSIPVLTLVSALLLGLLGGTLALAEESTLKEGAKKVGQKTGEVVHKVGEAGKEVGKKVAVVAVEVGHATRDGAKEFAKAVKGESGAQSDNKASVPTSSKAGSSASSVAHQHKAN